MICFTTKTKNLTQNSKPPPSAQTVNHHLFSVSGSDGARTPVYLGDICGPSTVDQSDRSNVVIHARRGHQSVRVPQEHGRPTLLHQRIPKTSSRTSHTLGIVSTTRGMCSISPRGAGCIGVNMSRWGRGLG